jgi:hypothetical protein
MIVMCEVRADYEHMKALFVDDGEVLDDCCGVRMANGQP